MPRECLPLFVAHAQPPKPIQPCEGPLHHPVPSAQPLPCSVLRFAKKRDDASVTLPDRLRVITTVA